MSDAEIKLFVIGLVIGLIVGAFVGGCVGLDYRAVTVCDEAYSHAPTATDSLVVPRKYPYCAMRLTTP